MTNDDKYPKYDYVSNNELSYEDNQIIIRAFELLMQADINPLDIIVEGFDVQYRQNGHITRELRLSYKLY